MRHLMISLICFHSVFQSCLMAFEDARADHFESKIRPILVNQCAECHSQGKKIRGGLLLDTKSGFEKGGDSGKVVVHGDPAQSLLIKAISYQDDLKMPPKSKLSDGQIRDLNQWVKDGAIWPEEKSSKNLQAVEKMDLQKRKQFWAWQFPKNQAVPLNKTVKALSPVDAFIQDRLLRENLKIAPQADKGVILRRLYVDLVGMLPTPEEVLSFESDSDPDGISRVVDRLLASPAFGERWARHWLDLVRYAESRGHEFDPNIPNAYQYRDYVIRALNEDVPYNQFVREHIAGDLLPNPRKNPVKDWNESVLGTGFLFLGEEVHSPVDVRQDQADRFDNRIDVFSKAFLGMTIACARCHDHKFDPILARDYYSLFAFLESSRYRTVRFQGRESNKNVARELERIRKPLRDEFKSKMVRSLQELQDKNTLLIEAARVVLQQKSDEPSQPGVTGLNRDLNKIAAQFGVDSVALSSLIRSLQAILKDTKSPTHDFVKALVLTKSPKQKPDSFAGQPPSGFRDLAVGKKIVVDYSEANGNQWMPDDVAFGQGPVKAGELNMDLDASRIKVHEFTAARLDPFWKKMRLSPGAEPDPGALGADRAGRTLSTPSFVVEDGFVHVLMEGKARLYFSVGAHVQIAGPLHGAMVRTVDQKQLGWVTFDLARYKGLPAHLEVSTNDPQFGLALVVQGDRNPCVNPTGSLDKVLKLAGRNPDNAAQFVHEAIKDLALSYGERGFPNGEKGLQQASLSNLLVELGFFPWMENESMGNPVRNPKFTSAIQILEKEATWESEIGLALMDGSSLEEKVFVRGSPKILGEPAPRAFLTVFGQQTPPKSDPGSGRAYLADWVTDPQVNPLAARVIVNRVWHHLFGRGLVASVDNFGELGEKPSHPELLDYIANRFVDEGWSVKKLIRLLVLSNVYQASSDPVQENLIKDPLNLLLSHMPLKRMEGEVIRDSMIELSGALDATMYGKSIATHLSVFQEGRGKPASGPLDGAGRRSVYLSVRRNFLSSFMLAFDAPIPFSAVGKRSVSNVPAQALILMNDPFVHQQSRLWAQRTLQAEKTTEQRLERMYLQAFSRKPSASEVQQCKDHLALAIQGESELEAWCSLAHAFWNIKEFVWVH